MSVMKKKNLLIVLIVVLIIAVGVYVFNQKESKPVENNPIVLKDQIYVMQFNEKETEIYKLTLDQLLGYEFNDLGDAEVRINLVNEGKVIQNFQSFFSNEKSQLTKMYVGFDKAENDLYDIILQTKSSLLSMSETLNNKIEFKKPTSMSSVVYLPEKIDTNQKIIILGAVGLSTKGVGNLEENAQIFDTSNVNNIEELYQRLSNQLGFEYCYLIELHQP